MGIVRRASTPAPPPVIDGAGGLEVQHGRAAGIQSVPCPGVDAAGRALPVTDDEWAARQEWLTNELAVIDAGDETADDVFATFMRNVDEERRRAGRPAAFGGPA